MPKIQRRHQNGEGRKYWVKMPRQRRLHAHFDPLILFLLGTRWPAFPDLSAG